MPMLCCGFAANQDSILVSPRRSCSLVKLALVSILEDYQGRQIAQARGIPIVGTIGLVVEASRAGLIAVGDVEPLLRQMTRAHFRVSERLIRHAVALARARR